MQSGTLSPYKKCENKGKHAALLPRTQAFAPPPKRLSTRLFCTVLALYSYMLQLIVAERLIATWLKAIDATLRNFFVNASEQLLFRALTIMWPNQLVRINFGGVSTIWLNSARIFLTNSWQSCGGGGGGIEETRAHRAHTPRARLSTLSYWWIIAWKSLMMAKLMISL